MRKEYSEKNGIIITYTDENVAFEERETTMSILISNAGSIIHNNFSDDPDKTRYFLEDFNRLYPTICYFRSLDQMGDAVSYLTDSLTGVLKGIGELEQAKEESLAEKYAVDD